MERPCGWATLYSYLLISLSVNVSNVFCQSISWEQIPPDDSAPHQTASKREVTQTPSPTKAQLINALFSYATAKGLLPKTTEIIQSTLPQEQPQCAINQNGPTFFNLLPLQTQIPSSCENKPIISPIPTISLNPISNQLSPPPTTAYPQAMLLKPTIKTEPISWSFSPQNCQGGCLENCQCSQQFPTIWQISKPSQPAIGVNNCPSIQPIIVNEAIPPRANLEIISPPCPPSYPPPYPPSGLPPSPLPCPPSCAQACPQPNPPSCPQPCSPPGPLPCPPPCPPPCSPPSLAPCPSPSIVPWSPPSLDPCPSPSIVPCSPPSLAPYPPPYIITPINNECSVESVCETNCGTLFEAPPIVTSDGKLGLPINLQINLPSPSDMCPSITIITAPNNPEPAPAFSPYTFPPPPVIMRKRSSLKKLLPIILLALIEDSEGYGGYGCPYNCDSDDLIPIPYPIPIPINNPVINCPYSSR